MKKVIFVAALILCALMVFSCKSAPKTQEDIDNALRTIYDRFRSDLVLEGAATYVVESGDTLSKISNSNYPNGNFFPLIMLASSDVVLDPDQIRPGMKLTIPNLDKNLENATAKGRIKSYIGEIAKFYERVDPEARPYAPREAKALKELADTL